MFERIVVATDGSRDGYSAVSFAASIARSDHARLVVAHVIEMVGGRGGVYPVAADEDEIRTRIAADVDLLKSDGVVAELVIHSVRLGGPARVIADVASAVHADLIVVGGKGRSALNDFLVGSVPTRLLHIAHRPVMIVPALADPGMS